ncbi:putative bifunctional diguanylate cyclase/phosphodiesterase [Maritalea mediterranea]|uniref:EAL domain-containing protein n=1 Tax=Maritalea mediterranea TaxID=2909667 RepID=A0ABS9E9B3_9HYPH|nr:EAL domain-containing protein [Maritalea mediterranea]MCF4098355.1 EAL domain-containing protein [Maritalea mediterranea]
MLADVYKKAFDYFSFANENDEVLIERLHAAKRQVPLMYSILIVNMAVLCFCLYGNAPFVLTVPIPGALILGGVIRMLTWVKLDINRLEASEARRFLRGVFWSLCALILLLNAWAFVVFVQVDLECKYHILFFMVFTIAGCMFGLTALPQAPMLILFLATIPAAVFLFLQEERIFSEIAFNMVMVVTLLLSIISNHDKYFRREVESRARLKKSNAKMNKLANIDSLTNVPNRRSFFRKLQQEVDAGEINSTTACSLLLIDLDGFKALNDLYGHAFGDKILKLVAQRLKAEIPIDGYFGRVGGDEFAIVCAGTDVDAIGRFAQKLMTAINNPAEINGIMLKLTATMGIASYPNDCASRESLFEVADIALCHAKQFSRSEIVFFEEGHADYILSTARTTKALSDADFCSELLVNFQPVWDSKHQTLVGFETLARWHSPTIGNVPPNEFIPIAETTGIITKITKCIFEKALRAAKDWPNHLKIGLNISAVDILNQDIVDDLVHLCKKHDIDPKRITIEITETAAIQNFEGAIACLKAFKEAGMSIAMDDFGAGHSSLSYLQHLPLDHVKLDKSFVQSIGSDTRGRHIASTLIDLCKSLQLGCIAEGIEDRSQLVELQKLGCTTFQGYFFSKPMLPDQTQSFIDAAAEEKVVLFS